MSVDFAVKMPKWSVTDNALYSLWDYLGMPVGKAPNGDARPTDLAKRAYNLCWNTYYRDENLQEEVDITASEKILFSNVNKDYFTSAFTTRQRGPITGLPVNVTLSPKDSRLIPFGIKVYDSNDEVVAQGESALYSYSDDISDPTNGKIIGQSIHYKTTGPNANVTTRRNVSAGTGGKPIMSTVNQAGLLDPAAHHVAYGVSANGIISHLAVSATTFDITDWRLAWQVQKWQERSMRGGVRYTEFLHSFFGVSPRDDRLQRPEYIGGTRTPVVTTEVLQTSQTTSGEDEASALATGAGHMISADSNTIGTYKAVEFGWIVGIIRIVPRVKYTDGINRQFLRNTPFDYYFPTFAHLSEQGIYNEEVFVTDDDESTNLSVWGYQGIYNEMRYKPNRVVAGLRDSSHYLYWTMARKFASLPNLNGNFISTEYMQNDFMRIFNIVDENLTRPCIVHIFHDIKARRPMPFLAIPM